MSMAPEVIAYGDMVRMIHTSRYGDQTRITMNAEQTGKLIKHLTQRLAEISGRAKIEAHRAADGAGLTYWVEHKRHDDDSGVGYEFAAPYVSEADRDEHARVLREDPEAFDVHTYETPAPRT